MKQKAVMFDLATLPLAALTVIAHFMPAGEGEVADRFQAAVAAILHQHAVLPTATYHARLSEEVQMRLRNWFSEYSLEQDFFEQVLGTDDPHIVLADEEYKRHTEANFWEVSIVASMIEDYLAENKMAEALAELADLKEFSRSLGPKQNMDEEITL